MARWTRDKGAWTRRLLHLHCDFSFNLGGFLASMAQLYDTFCTRHFAYGPLLKDGKCATLQKLGL